MKIRIDAELEWTYYYSHNTSKILE